MLHLLTGECGLTSSSVVADTGSGTGILSGQILREACRVYGVEPNEAMREASARLLVGNTCFESVDGRAEATNLPDESVDIITAAQSFQWFDRERARSEFERILKPDG